MKGDIKRIEFMAKREEWSYGISLYARQVIEGVSMSVAQPMVMERHEQHLISEPFARLDIQAAQQLIDELWQCGLRPSEGTGSAGSLKATEKHLADMQKIAFKGLRIKI